MNKMKNNTKNDNVERVLLQEDKKLIPLMKGDFYEYEPHLEKIKAAFEKLEIGEFSDEILKEIIGSGTSKIEVKAKTQIKDQLSRAGITSSFIVENAINQTKGVIQELQESLSNLGNVKLERSYDEVQYTLPIKDVGYEKGAFVIPEDLQESILEAHGRIYLETKEETDFYNAIGNLIEAYSDVKILADKAKYPIDSVKTIADRFFTTTKDGKLGIKPKMIKYVFEYHDNKMAMEKKQQEQRDYLAEMERSKMEDMMKAEKERVAELREQREKKEKAKKASRGWN